MFNIYHSNNLDVQKSILCRLLALEPQSDPFTPDTILVQSPGMAQWLQLKLAEENGIAANFHFPMPASFIWQQYVDNLPNVAEQSHFSKDSMTWRLMHLLENTDFQPILHYLNNVPESAQQKRYQLARKVADLFDQYLVYRPNWIAAWEQKQDELVLTEILRQQKQADDKLKAQITEDVQWQGTLWRALVEDINLSTQNGAQAHHRANLHRQYLSLNSYKNLPKRIFIFGISALPKTYLETFAAMSEHCDVHLFFNNPSQYYWGDIVDEKFAQKLALKKLSHFEQSTQVEIFSAEKLAQYQAGQQEWTAEQECLSIGNPLLATWGKLGRDFFYLLSELDTQDIQANTELNGSTLLTQIQRKILHLSPSEANSLTLAEQDQSLTFHACHSPMREVEVLHDYLLQCFQSDSNLTPKDIVVMVADIDRYAPYIQAVFGQYQRKFWHKKSGEMRYDNRYIPFSISDETLSESDVLLATFLNLLRLKDSKFSAEDVLALLDIPAIRTRFEMSLDDLEQLRHWVKDSGIRFGLLSNNTENQSTEQNLNSWQSGLERLLLGFAMREENGVWQQNYLGVDSSYGLKSQLVGALAAFIEALQRWHNVLLQSYQIEKWQEFLTALLHDFFAPETQTAEMLSYIDTKIQQITELLQDLNVDEPLSAEVMVDLLTEKLNEQSNSLKFLVGRVSFCTLLPMRSIPFKVVCLLGMNEQDYPRQQSPNSFDLMQYHRQKGDRFRRDDDRYLFLEALLAAEERLYISYIGQSIVDNTPLEPSVLVNQLLDYLAENLPAQGENAGGKSLITRHSMTAFSPENFSKNHRTFAREWAEIRNDEQTLPDFVQTMAHDSTNQHIHVEITQLIKFVQNPVQFFFEQQLGVYFRDQEEDIADSENFQLNQLDMYNIRQDLLTQVTPDFETYFNRLRLKGVLPRGEFAQVYAQEVRSEIEMFLPILQKYHQQTAESRYVDLSIEVGDKIVHLTGYLTNLFATNQRVVWRAGAHKDNYVIENWLYFLIQAVAENLSPANNTPAPIFYGREKGELSGKSFAVDENFDPLSVLKQYLQSYLASEQRMVLAVTKEIAKYLKNMNDSTASLRHIEEIANASSYGEYDSSDIYWQRVLKQTANLTDYVDEINACTSSWFQAMTDTLISVK
ncbi:hypothetical protein A4G18_02365 [Pasteurellaceae bacterium Pebbles2]|nr:hypothetical protein [Pasteurellaceae bacterium Pebbles2]